MGIIYGRLKYDEGESVRDKAVTFLSSERVED